MKATQGNAVLLKRARRAEKQGVTDKTVDITAGKQLPLGTAVGHRNVLWHWPQWDKGLAAQCYIQS